MRFGSRFRCNQNRMRGFMIRGFCAIPVALIVAACGGSDSNGPAAGFECLGQALPTTAPAAINVSGRITANFTSPSPVPHAYVYAFRRGDSTHLAGDTTDTIGNYSLMITTGGTPVDGYITVSDSNRHLDTFAYPAVPLAGGFTENVLMVSNTEFGILAASAGITPVAGDGFIGMVVRNCQGVPIAGATVSSNPAGEVAVHLAHAKSRARQHVPQLGGYVPAHLERLDVALAVQVVDQLRLAHLIDPAHARDTVRPSQRAPVRQPLLGRVFALDAVVADEHIEPGIEHVEDQPAARRQMVSDSGEELELIVHREEMLHHAKRGDDQREHRAEVELTHVGLREPHAPLHCGGFRGELRAAAVEHRRRTVEPGDGAPRARDGQQDSPRAAPDFEHRAARPFRLGQLEIDVLPRRIQRHAVVQDTEIGDRVIGGRHEPILIVNTRPARETTAFAARSETSGDSTRIPPSAPGVSTTVESAPMTARSVCVLPSCKTGVFNVA